MVTLTQFAEIDHALEGPGAPFDDQFAVLGTGLVSLTATATITDGDGDTATDSEVVDLGGNIRFADDGPTINVTRDQRGLGHADDAGCGDRRHADQRDTAVSTANFSGVFAIGSSAYGADGAGTTRR